MRKHNDFSGVGGGLRRCILIRNRDGSGSSSSSSSVSSSSSSKW